MYLWRLVSLCISWPGPCTTTPADTATSPLLRYSQSTLAWCFWRTWRFRQIVLDFIRALSRRGATSHQMLISINNSNKGSFLGGTQLNLFLFYPGSDLGVHAFQELVFLVEALDFSHFLLELHTGRPTSSMSSNLTDSVPIDPISFLSLRFDFSYRFSAALYFSLILSFSVKSLARPALTPQRH